ncbi:hypothetical protein ACROYT_G029409 [Oculina patagonica]
MSGAERKSSKDGNGDPPELDINLPKLRDLPTTKKCPSLPIDILLVTVKDCEFLSCYAHLRNSFKWYFDGLGYVYFGNAVDDQDADVKVALLRCNEGSTGPGSSLITLKNAATVLGPKGAISVGCCSGLNQEKSKLGDVVVSAKLTTYASKIVMDVQEQSTGTRSLVSRRFLHLIRHVADGWNAPLKIPEEREVDVHSHGEFLSGPEKVNADWRRKELVHSHPQAMAIEMEGEGLFAAAFDVGIEWLIAKGIADFADANESATAPWETFASVMAASVVFNFLSDANVFREWPHYQELPKQWKDEKGNIQDKIGEVEGNMKDKLEQVENQVKSVSEKMDNLLEAKEPSQVEAFLRLHINCEAIAEPGPLRDSSEMAKTSQASHEVQAKAAEPSTSCLPGTASTSGLGSVKNAEIPSAEGVLRSIAFKYFQTVDPNNPEELNGFLQYLKEVRKVLFVDAQLGSLIITVKCTSLNILEELWEDYCSGYLNEMAQRFLVTKDVLEEVGITEVKLLTTILEEEYRTCREFFLQSQDKLRNDLEQMKSEIGNMSEKLDTLVGQREETKDKENTRDNKLEQMKDEIGKMNEKLDSLMNQLPPVKKQPRIEDCFDPTKIIDVIRQLYKVREGWLAPFPWCEEFHFHLDDIFTRLKVVSRKKTRGTATTDTVNMSGIFEPHEECPQPRTVLIEGKPGMGKTTYCKKLVYDWATGKQEAEDCFPGFETVLLLRCRDMKSDLWEAIDDQLLPRNVKEDVRERFFDFIRHKQSNVLLILDGLDEVPANKLPMFSEIIQGRVLPKCQLVATARHEAGMKVRIHCDTLLEIEGFTEEDARKFIAKYFKTMEDLAKKLSSKLENDKNLKEMSANPLNTALLCLVCEEFQGVFPESRAELYMEIALCVLRRYIQKKGLSENNEDLIDAFKTQLKHLGRIALKGLHEGNLDFEESELGSHSADLPGFGFLSVQPGGSKLRPRRRYSFLHKSFQEFFAAFYLCCQLLDKEISADSLASDRRYLNELKEVLKFTCGMTAARCEETTEALVKSLTTQVNYEDDDDWFVLLECINECKKNQNSFHLKLARAFGSFLTLQTLTAGVSLSEADVVVLAEALKVNATVTSLDLSFNNVSDQGAASLAEALKGNITLTRLDLSDNNIYDDGAADLAEALKANTNLTRLDLTDNRIGDHGATCLAEALKLNTALTGLDLSNKTRFELADNRIGDHGATCLAEALKLNTSLTWLDLADNLIGDHGATCLAEALKLNTSLTSLDLSVNHIGEAAISELRRLEHDNRLFSLEQQSRFQFDSHIEFD